MPTFFQALEQKKKKKKKKKKIVLIVCLCHNKYAIF